MKYTPRRPLEDDTPNAYMESDTDYLLNNRALAVVLLDCHQSMVAALKLIADHSSPMITHVARGVIPKELL